MESNEFKFAILKGLWEANDCKDNADGSIINRPIHKDTSFSFYDLMENLTIELALDLGIQVNPSLEIEDIWALIKKKRHN
jgi:hypothetical protein